MLTNPHKTTIWRWGKLQFHSIKYLGCHPTATSTLPSCSKCKTNSGHSPTLIVSKHLTGLRPVARRSCVGVLPRLGVLPTSKGKKGREGKGLRVWQGMGKGRGSGGKRWHTASSLLTDVSVHWCADFPLLPAWLAQSTCIDDQLLAYLCSGYRGLLVLI